MKAKPIIYKEIKDYFKLDSEGNLWRLGGRGDKWCPCYLSKPNGKGYLQVLFRGASYRQHRIIYCLHMKQDISTDLQIDHINGVRNDNRIENLRLVTNRENAQNQSCHRGDKLVGVKYDKHIDKWGARITLADGEQVSLGSFNSEIEANARYLEALELIHLTKEEIQKHFNIAQFTSKHKGVFWHKRDCKWCACITVNGKSKHLGYFKTEEEAYEAYIKFKGGVTSDTI